MELLRPFHPHHGIAIDPLSGFSSPESFRRGCDQTASSSRSTEAVDDAEKVYVAVGRTVEKAVGLIRWCSERFSGGDICIVHVHQPSPVIPTLLGKLPVAQASVEVVSNYRREEKLQLKKLLMNYLAVCRDLKVKVSIVATEAEQVHKGIVQLVGKYGIRRLVMGAVPENCMKVKRSSSKASYAARNAPLFCEILFVNKGKHIWTRDATEGPVAVVTNTIQPRANEEVLRCDSLSQSENKLVPSGNLEPSTRSIGSTRLDSWFQGHAVNSEVHFPNSSCQCLPSCHQSSCSHTSTSNSLGLSSDEKLSLENELKVEDKKLYNHLIDAQVEEEASSNEVVQELLKRQQLETEAMEAIGRVKIFQCAYAHEAEIRKEAEDMLRTVVHDHEKLLEEREELKKELQRTMRNIAFLDSRTCEINRRHDEAAEEFNAVQSSIATLRLEKQRLRRQKMEAVHWLERWRNRGPAFGAKCNWYPGLGEDMPELAEFPLSEIQTATCYFSESFKIGQGGFGCVYKGEMLGRTVAIKKLHPHNMQGQFEFQQEVQVLSKLQHPHLVNLLGVCPEAWSLVYEYLPNGSLQDRLFRKNNHPSLPWKDRARMIAEISSALCFLHSSKPEKIVHGDLKPENILLDSDWSCRICDFGILRLVSEDPFCCPSFRRSAGPRSAFPHTDPESYRDGLLTPKSDSSSFGLIILQLLTGRPPVALVGEVRKAVSCGNLDSILDSSAGEWPQSVAIRLATLGLECCESNPRSRPDLTPSLVRELEQLHAGEERPVPNYFLCPILQEIMHDPQIAADGFTYEGEALRGWLENGRDTSPMTNLKLSHLNLTPNHALRMAIQDWLCKV